MGCRAREKRVVVVVVVVVVVPEIASGCAWCCQAPTVLALNRLLGVASENTETVVILL